MEWTNWNWLNVFLMFSCGYFAYTSFEDGNEFLGWGNLVGSAANAASVALRLL